METMIYSIKCIERIVTMGSFADFHLDCMIYDVFYGLGSKLDDQSSGGILMYFRVIK